MSRPGDPGDEHKHRCSNLLLLSLRTAGMTPEVIQTGLAMAVKNIEHFLKGTPTHVVTPPR